MEDKKYYTPEIEEFCIGFEYEFLTNHGSSGAKWENRIIECISDTEDDPYMGLTLNSLEKYNNVYIRNAWRVKYLDQEDIESLGWCEDNGTYKIGDSILFIYKDRDITIKKYYITVFEGTIKNKSELKRIMKQIGI